MVELLNIVFYNSYLYGRYTHFFNLFAILITVLNTNSRIEWSRILINELTALKGNTSVSPSNHYLLSHFYFFQ